MSQNLVIVESPAKAKTIEKFLGKDYKVMSSYGHIRDLKKKSFRIDMDSMEPQYEVPADKTHIVSQLKQSARQADVVWLASDEDREGEAISWHLQEVLHLKPATTRRIVFHEITKPAILRAIEEPRTVDMDLVNAQQARRVLDRIVGFKLSPVLWRKVKPNLSAGRVQSVAVRLIVEREREVQAFQSEAAYRISAILRLPDGTDLRAELNHRFRKSEDVEAFLHAIKDARMRIDDIQTRPIRRTPAPPFTTSTLQQEAAHKLGFPVAQTMLLAQRLYENGLITYMRTDSVNLSQLALGASRTTITDLMGEQYVKIRQYHTSTKGAQEAHEAIRPTYIDRTELTDATPGERRLYDLIWKRTIASQMADAELEKTTATISIEGRTEQFVATGEVLRFDGFLRVYRETTETADDDAADDAAILPPLTLGQELTRVEVQATQRWSQRPARYNEASLVRKLEELGIGRPSTYAPTISTIQQREYVERGDKPGDEHTSDIITLKSDGTMTHEQKNVVIGAERGRLLPTDTGIVTTDFLVANFPSIMDYNFTAAVEKDFDSIAEGHEEWHAMMRRFWTELEPFIDESINTRSDHRAGERVLGTDPASGRQVSVKIGRFGPVAQIGTADEPTKPRFAQLLKGQSLESITLDEALELFRLPRTLGTFEEKDVSIGTGRFGPYVHHDDKYISLPKGADPLSITLPEAIQLIEEKRQSEQRRHLRLFDEDPDLEVIAGRYGPYITYKGENYRIAKAMHEQAASLTYEECMDIIREQADRPKTTTRRFARKK